ncbi:hypothetical protein Ga0074812_15719 [Parafrankia irregularis]|uniref:Uncharacterized protein n=1 Tax=Parafrankia irregularis TaxID=795642 RepID=A0A0S4R0S3_9ACTN|nr:MULTISPECIES: hypothetical protein [Parafrankia]MBE3206816.1 hypothetical protein [Parafrankia sp. CH37]CUU61129.1 hypothetical protein Ga0074812_15719 [Parafrankia irregularis]
MSAALGPVDPSEVAAQTDALRAGIALLAVVNGAVPLLLTTARPAVGLVVTLDLPFSSLSLREQDEQRLAGMQVLSEVLGRPLVPRAITDYLSLHIDLVLFDVRVALHAVVRDPDVRAAARQVAAPVVPGVEA